MEPLYWQILFWVIQILIFVPLTSILSVIVIRTLEKRKLKIINLVVGDWKSSFKINESSNWINQTVNIRKSIFSNRLLVTAKGVRTEFDWQGHLDAHNLIFTGAWENVSNPTIAGAQSLDTRHLYTNGFVVGATTGSNNALEKTLRTSTWLMAKTDKKLQEAKSMIVSNMLEKENRIEAGTNKDTPLKSLE